MKIGVSATGKDLESLMDSRFGRCNYFILVDPDTEEFEAMDNPGVSAGGGAGIQAAQAVMKQGAEAVITGHCGPNAFDVLAAGGIKIYQASEKSIEEVLDLYKKGELKEVTTPGKANRGKGSR
ncbi:MAG: NifB/NifX family molybdenum-iron cluster-binding protein [Syntrophaceticus sp.]|nr:NifB/NifX family molybdenum-iron cluster-binding protein [Syntrophaceticus sp.]MDD3315557.1 NifB/NifX family molybdenum-iron cluster-binding protein [Syntrophaceticus sp.]MDD4360597.1 NifB/NifX family molybdenum-iron cluster-binding protein [Syntrophaceticus sp.]MDD4783816.1 NifB/NifX family molybdenum-iron cluster-binding protein [Syntrophaceticus sp.]HBI27386.1 dinitrogenase iron-molybdenum cofactor biosynthesis protein [Peptococcaceae bacterium]